VTVGKNADDQTAAAKARMEAVARQEQFLTVLSRDAALARFRAHVPHRPLGPETVPLVAAPGRVLAADIVSPIDVPPFDRSGVDGFAVRAADILGASGATPKPLRLNDEILACGVAPTVTVAPGTATPIATGGVIPRGADAVVMIEQTDWLEGAAAASIVVRKAASPGQFIAYAGSDMARGEAVLRAGTPVTAREIGMLAACGLAEVAVVRRPRVAVLSTGDELVPPGEPLRTGRIYDSNGAFVAASVAENGGEPIPFGAFPDEEALLDKALRAALATCDLVVLSGGTSKGAGDVSHRILARFGPPGILVHGVALKPGKPLCLAVADGKPVVVLPGFPTSAMFTFHDFVVPLIRAMAGLAPREEASVEARVGQRLASEQGRAEFVMVALSETAEGLVALPLSKGSGSVTAFSQADGFLTVEAERAGLEAGERRSVTLIGAGIRPPDLTIVGSHCIGLDVVLDRLAALGIRGRTIAIGSAGGLAAARRGECDFAAVHLLDPQTGRYNAPFLSEGQSLVPGWQRLQGVVFRPGDQRFAVATAQQAAANALADGDCVMVNRNTGSGTRLIVDGLLGGCKPPGFFNQPRSHNAVAAAVAQERADWGVAIASVARLYGLGFLPLTGEQYDFIVPDMRRNRPAVAAFVATLNMPETREALVALGFGPPASPD